MIFNIGQRIHFHNDTTDTGTVVGIRDTPKNVIYTIKWDSPRDDEIEEWQSAFIAKHPFDPNDTLKEML